MRFLLIFIIANLMIGSSFAKYSKEQYMANKNLVSIYDNLIKDGYNMTSLYCSCPLYVNKNKLYYDRNACSYEIQSNQKRGMRIEHSHIVPPSFYKHNKNFETINTDLHNIYPAIGELVANRLNYAFSDDIHDNSLNKSFGSCSFYIDKNTNTITPPNASKGIIARAYLYMHDKYQIKLSKNDLELFTMWDKLYLPSKEECKRNTFIERIQGNSNKFIKNKCF